MSSSRRSFMGLMALSAASPRLLSAAALRGDGSGPHRVKALLFDGFPIFDPRPIYKQVEQMYPGQGEAFSNLWRTRQFDYQWLRVVGKRYANFWQATEDGLIFAAKQLKLDMNASQRAQLMQGFVEMKAWPDVLPALQTLRNAGIRLAFLSNLTEAMLAANVRSAGLDGLFEHLISTDRIKSYKPDPRTYQLGIDIMGLKREEMVFVPSSGWDNAGAKWFGYRTCWINRAQSPVEELDAAPDAMGASLEDLVRFVLPTT
ncbi:MAG: haloacid dehalogenase type II [Rhodocyclaceae bacterium]|nr:MAG: haloacid dehalogenase type II [Rhodocyclaceae bacterium]